MQLSHDEIVSVSFLESDWNLCTDWRRAVAVEQVSWPKNTLFHKPNKSTVMFCARWRSWEDFTKDTLTLRHACHNHRVSSKWLQKIIWIKLRGAFMEVYVHATLQTFLKEDALQLHAYVWHLLELNWEGLAKSSANFTCGLGGGGGAEARKLAS